MKKIMLLAMASMLWFGTARSGEEVDFLEVFSGSMGGSWYASGSEIAAIIQEKIPGMTSRVAPGGGEANPPIIQKRQGLLGMVYSGAVIEAFKGIGSFKEPHPDIRHIASITYMPLLWFGLRSDDRIKSLADLSDKRISPGRTGQTGLTIARESLAAHGIELNDITKNGGTVSLLGDAERMNMIRDRHLDAASGLFPLDHSELQSLSLSPGIKLITMDPERIPIIQSRFPGLVMIEIPPGRFDKHQTEKVYTIASVVTLIGHADLSDELVYNLTKALIESHERLNRYFTPDDVVIHIDPLAGKADEFPVHPGAMKYFKEKGFAK